MATQYNSLAPPFTDKKTMENYEFASSRKPSESFIHPVECKSSVTPVSILYTRSGALPANADQRLYDLGEFNIATQGMQAASGNCAELWATYEVEFFKCKSDPQDQTDHFQLAGAGNGAPLGLTTKPGTSTGSSLGGSINALGTIYSFPPNLQNGKYLVITQWTGTSVAITPPTLGFTGCRQLQLWRNDGFSQVNGPSTGQSATCFISSYVVEVFQQNASITWGTAGTLPSGTLEADLWVTQISNSIIA